MSTERIKVMPHTDAFMRGDRYGRVIFRNEAGVIALSEQSNTTVVLFDGDFETISA